MSDPVQCPCAYKDQAKKGSDSTGHATLQFYLKFLPENTHPVYPRVVWMPKADHLLFRLRHVSVSVASVPVLFSELTRFSWWAWASAPPPRATWIWHVSVAVHRPVPPVLLGSDTVQLLCIGQCPPCYSDLTQFSWCALASAPLLLGSDTVQLLCIGQCPRATRIWHVSVSLHEGRDVPAPTRPLLLLLFLLMWSIIVHRCQPSFLEDVRCSSHHPSLNIETHSHLT